ncbi:CapA family protein [Saliphagus sp. GCM10025308]
MSDGGSRGTSDDRSKDTSDEGATVVSDDLETVIDPDPGTGPDQSGGDRWSMVVAGDCALNRDARPTADRTVSSPLRERIGAADVSILNVEAPIVSEKATPIDKSGPCVENPDGTAETVANVGFDVCTLANNHVRDYGPEGVVTTLEALHDANLATVGVGSTPDEAYESLAVGPDGPVAVVNVCEQEFNLVDERGHGAAWLSDRRAREAIRAADREYDCVIVVAHSGVEYVPFPAPQLQGLLREFVDIGADLVVGHHPHVPQGWERYDDGAIFYSLGNFLFDSMTDEENTSWGLVLEVEFDGSTPVAVELVPTETVDGVVHPLGLTRDREDYLSYLHRLAEITTDAATLEAYWQEIAVQVFYERYSNWLHTGVGANLSRARSAPNDPRLQRSIWDPETRRAELFVLLNVIRAESHRWLTTTALEVLSGEGIDRRTPEIRDEAQQLLARTARE